MPAEASTPTSPRTRNIGEPNTTATTTDPAAVNAAASSPAAPTRPEDPAVLGAGIRGGSQRGSARGVRWSVRHHGFPTTATVAAGPCGSLGRVNRTRLDPSSIVVPSTTDVVPAIGSPSMRQGTRPVSWTTATAPSASTVRST